MFHQCPEYSKNQIEILGYVDVYIEQKSVDRDRESNHGSLV